MWKQKAAVTGSHGLREGKGVLGEGNGAQGGPEAATSVLFSWENEANSLIREGSSCRGRWEVELDKYGKARILEGFRKTGKIIQTRHGGA